MLALEPVSTNWDLETDIQDNITLMIKSSTRFIKNEIEFIVDTLSDYELLKFDVLRKFGWCS